MVLQLPLDLRQLELLRLQHCLLHITPPREEQPSQLIQSLRQQPDRLDGHPLRTPRPRGDERFEPVRNQFAVSGPYFAGDAQLWDCPDLPHTVRLRQLKALSNYETDDEESNDSVNEELYTHVHPADTSMTGKAASKEISHKDLNQEDRKKFDVSMQKEWDSWKSLELLNFSPQNKSNNSLMTPRSSELGGCIPTRTANLV